MTAMHTRKGTLIIVVAGMSAVLATMAVTFAVKVRSESTGADQVVRMAQARILLNAVMTYTLYQIDQRPPSATQVKDGLEQGVFGLSNPLNVPLTLIPADPDRQATFHSAWIILGPAIPDATDPNSYILKSLIGSGPTFGMAADKMARRYEPRYQFDITLTPGSGLVPAQISKITPIDITL